MANRIYVMVELQAHWKFHAIHICGKSRMRGQNTTVYLYVNTDYRLVASFMAGEYMQIVSFILS